MRGRDYESVGYQGASTYNVYKEKMVNGSLVKQHTVNPSRDPQGVGTQINFGTTL